MRTIIYVHPYQGSFCNAILNKVKQEEDHIIDLYKDKFNPIYSANELAMYNEGQVIDPTILNYQDLLTRTTELIIITPIWWNNVPGILKGFFDKVFTKNFAYTDSSLGVKGKLENIKFAMVITTSNSPIFYLRINGVNHNLKMTLKQIGIRKVHFKQLGTIKQTTLKQRKQFLNKLVF